MVKRFMPSGTMQKMASTLALLVVIALVAACVAPGAQQGGGAAGGQAAASGPTAIRISCWESGDALEPFQKSIDSFQKANPSIKVSLECIPQDYGTKLLAQLAAGSGPDIFQVGDGDVAKYVQQGAVQPLDDYINGKASLDMNVFYPNVAKFGQVGGKTYFLTKDYSPLILFYNKKLFDEAKVEYPNENWKWEDLAAAAKKLTKADGSQWGIELPDSWGDLTWLRGALPIIYQNGGSVVSDDGKTTTGHLNSPETVQAVQWYADLVLKDKVAPNKTDIDALQGVDLFQTGKVAMLWTGRWPMKDFQKNKDLSFGTTTLPAGPKGKANALCWAGFTINSASKNKDTALQILKYIAAGDGAKEFSHYALTAVKAIADSQNLAKDEYNAPVIKVLDDVKPLPEFTTPKWGDCGDKAYKAAMEEIFLKGTAVQSALDSAAKDADSCLAK